MKKQNVFKISAIALAIFLAGCKDNAPVQTVTVPASSVAASVPVQAASTPAQQESGVKVNELASIVKLDTELKPFVQTNPALWLGDPSDPFMGDIDAMNAFLAEKGASRMSGVYDFGLKGLKLIAFSNHETNKYTYLAVTNDTAVKVDITQLKLLQGGDSKLNTLWEHITEDYKINNIHFLDKIEYDKTISFKNGDGSKKILAVLDPENAESIAFDKVLRQLQNTEVSIVLVSMQQTDNGRNIIESIWSQAPENRLKAWQEYVDNKTIPTKQENGEKFNWGFSQNAVKYLAYKLPTAYNLANKKSSDKSNVADLETNPASLEKWLSDTSIDPEVETILKIKPLWTDAEPM